MSLQNISTVSSNHTILYVNIKQHHSQFDSLLHWEALVACRLNAARVIDSKKNTIFSGVIWSCVAIDDLQLGEVFKFVLESPWKCMHLNCGKQQIPKQLVCVQAREVLDPYNDFFDQINYFVSREKISSGAVWVEENDAQTWGFFSRKNNIFLTQTPINKKPWSDAWVFDDFSFLSSAWQDQFTALYTAQPHPYRLCDPPANCEYANDIQAVLCRESESSNGKLWYWQTGDPHACVLYPGTMCKGVFVDGSEKNMFVKYFKVTAKAIDLGGITEQNFIIEICCVDAFINRKESKKNTKIRRVRVGDIGGDIISPPQVRSWSDKNSNETLTTVASVKSMWAQDDGLSNGWDANNEAVLLTCDDGDFLLSTLANKLQPAPFYINEYAPDLDSNKTSNSTHQKNKINKWVWRSDHDLFFSVSEQGSEACWDWCAAGVRWIWKKTSNMQQHDKISADFIGWESLYWRQAIYTWDINCDKQWQCRVEKNSAWFCGDAVVDADLVDWEAEQAEIRGDHSQWSAETLCANMKNCEVQSDSININIDSLSFLSKTLDFSAQSCLEFKCGGASLTLDKSGVVLQGSNIQLLLSECGWV